MTKLIYTISFLLTNILLTHNLFGQNLTFPNREIIISDDVNLKSIDIQNITKNYQLPFAKLGEQLLISFDYLDADKKNYYYSLEHYDSNWEKSDIFDNDFIEGYNEGEVVDYAYSFNALQKYTHYSFIFPSNNMNILISGNYLLKVYLDDDEEPSFVRRLVFYEDIITIGAKVDRASVVGKRDTEQQVNFILNHKDFNIDNPSTEIKVNILQNNNWENAVYGLKYQYIGTNTLIYNYLDKSNFTGGNSFFRFDTKTIQAAGLFTDYIRLEDIYNTYLYPNLPRANLPFSSQDDYNGGFVIRSIDGGETITNADYSNVHFYLDVLNTFKNSSIYVFGAFNDWRFEEVNRLKYNKDRDLFETEILLKQGYYDYKYVVLDDDGTYHPDQISGSFYQTENNYSIIVYYKGINSRYDRVIGFYQLRTVELF